MKVKILLPQESVHAEIKAYDPDGKEVRVSRLEISPLFFRSDERPNVLFADVEADGKVFDRAVLHLAGSNGKLSITHRTATVTPAFARSAKPGRKEEVAAEPVSEKGDKIREAKKPAKTDVQGVADFDIPQVRRGDA